MGIPVFALGQTVIRQSIRAACLLAFLAAASGCLRSVCNGTDITCPGSGPTLLLTGFALTLPCLTDYTGVTQSQRSPFYLAELRNQALLGSGSVTATTIPSTVVGGNKWLGGGVLAPNGLIYGIPDAATEVLVIDPNTNTASTFAAPADAATRKWAGGALAADGKIYAAGRGTDNLLVIDPVTNTATTIPSSIVSGAGNRWLGLVHGGNGKLYGIPQGEDNIVVIDPKANGNFCDAMLMSGYMNSF